MQHLRSLHASIRCTQPTVPFQLRRLKDEGRVKKLLPAHYLSLRAAILLAVGCACTHRAPGSHSKQCHRNRQRWGCAGDALGLEMAFDPGKQGVMRAASWAQHRGGRSANKEGEARKGSKRCLVSEGVACCLVLTLKRGRSSQIRDCITNGSGTF